MKEKTFRNILDIAKKAGVTLITKKTHSKFDPRVLGHLYKNITTGLSSPAQNNIFRRFLRW
ncbi:unnamed protein product [Tenebrio molitor]|nr:unnamed protein product [Tenebrio molitor]